MLLKTRAPGTTEWTLLGVVPKRWTGPSLSVDNAKACTESLEIYFNGFG